MQTSILVLHTQNIILLLRSFQDVHHYPQGKACVSICIPSCGRPLGAALCLVHCKHLEVRAERGQIAKQLYKCCCVCQNNELMQQVLVNRTSQVCSSHRSFFHHNVHNHLSNGYKGTSHQDNPGNLI